VSVKERK